MIVNVYYRDEETGSVRAGFQRTKRHGKAIVRFLPDSRHLQFIADTPFPNRRIHIQLFLLRCADSSGKHIHALTPLRSQKEQRPLQMARLADKFGFLQPAQSQIKLELTHQPVFNQKAQKLFFRAAAKPIHGGKQNELILFLRRMHVKRHIRTSLP